MHSRFSRNSYKIYCKQKVFISFLFIFFLSACQIESSVKEINSTDDKPQTTELLLISQQSSAVTSGTTVVFTGTYLNKISEIRIGNEPCIFNSQLQTTLSCSIASELPKRTYDVSYKLASAPTQTLNAPAHIIYYAGAEVFGMNSFDTIPNRPTYVFSIESLDVINDYMFIANKDFYSTYDAYSSTMIYSHSLGSENGYNPYLGLSISGKYFSRISSSCSNSSQVFLVDSLNNRILVHAKNSFGENSSPTYVLGQSTFTDTNINKGSSPSGSGFNFSNSDVRISCNSSNLFVPDSINNRVLVFTLPITSNSQAAVAVIGQSNFTTTIANNGGLSATSLSLPNSTELTSSHLFISDSGNNRVLIYSLPISTGAAAIKVIGQADMTSAIPATTQSGLNSPRGILANNNRLYVADSENHRIIFFNISNVSLLSDGPNATGVLGQPDYISNYINYHNPGSGATSSDSATQSGLWSPSDIAVHGGRLYIADTNNHRILSFPDDLPNHLDTPNIVLGQQSYTTNNRFNNIMNSTSFPIRKKPFFTLQNSGSFWLTSEDTPRATFFSDFSASAATRLLGQINYTTSNTLPNDRIDSTQIHNPRPYYDVLSDVLYIADKDLNRVLIWTTPVSSDNQSPDYVVGQPDFTTYTNNVSATSTPYPVDVCTNSTTLFIASKHRITLYDKSTLANGMTADAVLGQNDFSTHLANRGTTTSADSFNTIQDIFCDDSRLVVADSGNNRVLIWNLPITPLGAPPYSYPADIILGQNLDTDSNTGSWPSLTTFNKPSAVALSGTTLVVGNSGQLLIFDDITGISTGSAADRSIGSHHLIKDNLKYFPDYKNRVDNFTEISELRFVDADRIAVGVIGRVLILPYKAN